MRGKRVKGKRSFSMWTSRFAVRPALVFSFVIAVGCGPVVPHTAAPRLTEPAKAPYGAGRTLLARAPSHVVIVIEENHSYSEIAGNSKAAYINWLMRRGARFTNYHGVEHPSEPNYLDLFSGSNQGVTDDSCPHTFTAPNLASELMAHKLGFAGYSENLPSMGYTGCTNMWFTYARKHNPWVNFTNVPSRDNLPFSRFPKNYSALPTVSFVIPNVRNDMHSGSIQAGDEWLKSHLDGYVRWAQHHNSLLIVTWDEDDESQDNRIATLFFGPMVKPGVYSEHLDHFNLLRTIEDLYGLPHAGRSAQASPIANVWRGTSGIGSGSSRRR